MRKFDSYIQDVMIGSKQYLPSEDKYIFIGEVTENGECYKDSDEFNQFSNNVCYMDEWSLHEYEKEIKNFEENGGKFPDSKLYGYTYKTLLEIVDGNKELCEMMFYDLDYCSPEVWYDDYNSRN